MCSASKALSAWVVLASAVLALSAGCSMSHGIGPDAGSDASGVRCGWETCAVGEVCCNESCGICTPPGGSCTTVDCDMPGPCAPDDARGEGACRVILGYAWTGESCASVGGCTCVGADCGALFGDITACLEAHRACPRVCGGWVASPCLSDELCDYPDGSYCGGDDSSGVCIPRPDGCPEPGGIPVCGCDGNDYDSECSAHFAGTDVAITGSCESPSSGLREARMNGECGPIGGSIQVFTFSSEVTDCSAPLERRLEIRVFRRLEGAPGDVSIPIDGTFAGAMGIYCEGGPSGTCTSVTGGVLEVHAFRDREVANVGFEVTLGDGRSFVERDLFLGGVWCPFAGEGCH